MTDRINLINQDFDELKQSFIQYLQSKPEFTDYDFTGSGWNVLIDVLAYNTHYNAFYLNFVANESFLSSGTLRESVVDKAKEIGYVPISRRAAKATINLKAIPSANSTTYNSLATVTMPTGTVFITNIDGKNYEFVTINDKTLTKDIDGNFIIDNVDIYQGQLLSYRWEFDSTNPVKFIIPSDSVDVSTLKVVVQKSALDNTTTVFKPASDFSDKKGTNPAYWTWEVEKGYYELEFGDGFQGKPIVDGNIVRAEYVVTKGDEANKAFLFEAVGSIQGLSNIEVETVVAAYGGAEKESIEQIKFNAIRQFSSQNRAVTTEDYESILLREFPFIESVSVWGGQENDPPEYGKVFISIKPFEGLTITDQVKEDIERDVLSKYNIIPVSPEIVDPDFIFLNLVIDAEYDELKTTLSASDIKNGLINIVNDFESDYLGKFQNSFIHSDLVCLIRDSDTAITSVLIGVIIEKRIPVNLGQGTYEFTFSNAVRPKSFEATGFTLIDLAPPEGSTYIVRDDGLGNLFSYRVVDGVESKLLGAGTINYDTGFVNLIQIDIISVDREDQNIVCKADPVEDDVESATNKIIVIEPQSVDISVTVDD